MVGKEEYIQSAKQRNKRNTLSSFEIVMDIDEILEFESKTGKQLGVINNEPYYNIHLDLCKHKVTGELFRYTHIEYLNEGKVGVAVLVVLKTKDVDLYVLEKHYRFLTNKYHYEIPRGYTDLLENAELTVIRELYEETGLKVTAQQIQLIGTICPDTSLCNAQVNLYAVEIRISEEISLTNLDKLEEIHSYKLVAVEEYNKMVKCGEINDSFTLAAILKYQLMYK